MVRYLTNRKSMEMQFSLQVVTGENLRIKSKAEGVKIRIRSDARILEQGPGATYFIAAFENSIRIVW